MSSRGHLLYLILLPLLAQVGADDTKEEIMTEEMSRGHVFSPDPAAPPELTGLPNPLPHSLFLHLLRSGAFGSKDTTNPIDDNEESDDDISSSDVGKRVVCNPLTGCGGSHLSPDLAVSPELTSLPNPLPHSLFLHLLRGSSAFGSKHTTNLIDNEESDDDISGSDVAKRVFCNGFTGCGGRHRDRSRRQEKYGKRLIPVLVKRPFCNSFGCYNGKRTTRALTGFSLSGPSMRARLLAASLERASEGGKPPATVPGKRLFCNGYGGCRGGKRSLWSKWLPRATKRTLWSKWLASMESVAATGR